MSLSVLVLITIVVAHCSLTGGYVKVSLLNEYSFGADAAGTKYFKCFISESDLGGVSVSSRRVANTRNYNSNNPRPYNPFRDSPGVYTVSLQSSDNRAFGVFACDVTLDGESSSVQTILLRSNAYIVPKDRLLTKTVNIDESTVTIEMEEVISYPRGPDWRKDGLSPLSVAEIFSLTVPYYTSRELRTTDAGVYECHHGGRRDEALHGLQRLIVRACQSGRWGPPSCSGVCDNCYHGGVCEDNTGACICPAGFMGPNCLTACRLGMFGFRCEFSCGDSSTARSACRGAMICLTDPFGCRCASGFEGLGCETRCEPGFFGANCEQQCHCQSGSDCNDYTGACPDGCTGGYTGASCQIPVECKTGHYGDGCILKCLCVDNVACDRETGRCSNDRCIPGYGARAGSENCQECEDGLFGEGCSQECHCAEPCDDITGACTGVCKTPWIHWAPKCQTGISDISYIKVNPDNQVGGITCTLSSPNNIGSIGAFMYTVSSGRPFSKIQASRTTTTYTALKNVTFTAHRIGDGEEIACVLTVIGTFSERAQTNLFRTTTVSSSDPGSEQIKEFPVVKVLPTLSGIPEVISATNDSLTISWRAWDEAIDGGDPPVVGYQAYLLHRGEEVSESEPIPHPITEYTFEGLQPDTVYKFRVAAEREGPNGVGQKTQRGAGRTKCRSPLGAPINVDVEEMDGGDVVVSWETPKNDTIMCSTGISMFKIYYMAEGVEKDMRTVNDPSTTSQTIDMILEAGKNYIFQMSLFTSGGESPFSEEAHLHLVVTVSVSSDGEGLSDKVAGDSPLGFIMGILIALLVLVVLALVIIFLVIRRKRNSTSGKYPQDASYPDTQTQSSAYDVVVHKSGDSGTDNAYANNEANGQHQASVAPVVLPMKGPVVEDWEGEEEEMETAMDEDNIYGNLEKPEPVRVTDLPDYVTEKTQSKTDSLIHQFMILPRDEQYPCTVGKKTVNRKKNRFRNMLPYDNTRVILDPLPKDPHSDYYNACFVKDQNGKVAFIASQGPNKASIDDFWRMVWMTDISIIVMATNLIEAGKDRCTQYWPEKENQLKQWGKITISWTGTQQFANHIIREFTISQDGVQRTVSQYHFVTWPDMGVPSGPTALISLVRQVKRQNQGKTAPILVHCSAGIGRTGTFIALYCLTDILSREKYINVYEFVEKMREDRVNMVQTAVQYQFLYDALVEVHLTNHTEIPTGLLVGFNIQSKKQLMQEEYQLLNDLSKNMKLKSTAGREPDNVVKNRFPDIIPPDCNRPFLSNDGGFKENDYINATFVSSYGKRDAFITTQSPLPHTIEGYWRLVCDWKVPVIVMLNQLDGSNEECPQYWTDAESSSYGSVTVTRITQEDHGTFMHRQFEVTIQGRQAWYVDHFQLLSWLDSEGCPSGLPELLHSATLLLAQHPEAPSIIQCIDGVGCSGSVAVVLSEIDRIRAEDRVDIFQSARQLRTSNGHFLHKEHHYILCYKIL